MQIVIHRVNTVAQLKKVAIKYGVEIDVRGYGEKMFLNHEPIDDTDKSDGLENYLREFHHALLIFDIKEAGYEQRVINLAKKYGIANYFLLDVEFPYFYCATRQEGVRKIAIRYSEAEPIELVEAQIVNGQPLVDWVWIDTNTRLPLDRDVIKHLKQFKTCLVCPERWGRPQDISTYIKQMKKLDWQPDAVMTAQGFANQWEKYE